MRTIILWVALSMLSLSGCNQDGPYYQAQQRYNDADAIRAAEYEKMQTQQKSEYLKNSNLKEIQVNP